MQRPNKQMSPMTPELYRIDGQHNAHHDFIHDLYRIAAYCVRFDAMRQWRILTSQR